jgi:hypothetical protein
MFVEDASSAFAFNFLQSMKPNQTESMKRPLSSCLNFQTQPVSNIPGRQSSEVPSKIPGYFSLTTGSRGLYQGTTSGTKQHIFALRRVSPLANKTKFSVQSTVSQSSMDSGCPLSPPAIALTNVTEEDLFLECENFGGSIGPKQSTYFSAGSENMCVGLQPNNTALERPGCGTNAFECRPMPRSYTFSSESAFRNRRNTIPTSAPTLKTRRNSWVENEPEFFEKIHNELVATEVQFPRPDHKIFPSGYNLRSELFWIRQSVIHSLKWLFNQVSTIDWFCWFHSRPGDRFKIQNTK